MDYVEWMECIEAQETNKSWAKQVESRNSQEFSLSYALLESAPVEPTEEYMPIHQGNSTMNTQISLGLESLAIPCQTNQLADL